MDCRPPDSSVRVILQAGILEWVTISFSLDALLFTQFVQQITEGEAGEEIWSSVDSYFSFLCL